MYICIYIVFHLSYKYYIKLQSITERSNLAHHHSHASGTRSYTSHLEIHLHTDKHTNETFKIDSRTKSVIFELTREKKGVYARLTTTSYIRMHPEESASSTLFLISVYKVLMCGRYTRNDRCVFSWDRISIVFLRRTKKEARRYRARPFPLLSLFLSFFFSLLPLPPSIDYKVSHCETVDSTILPFINAAFIFDSYKRFDHSYGFAGFE